MIKEGQIWVKKYNFLHRECDVWVKVLKVTERKVFLMAKTFYGFKDLDPFSVDIKTFLDYYLYVDTM